MAIIINKSMVKDGQWLDTILTDNNGELESILETAIEDQIKDMDNLYKAPDAPRKLSIELTLAQSDTDHFLVGVGWKVTPKPAAFDRTPQDDPARGQMQIDDIQPEETEK